jgi:hypothetical protein
LSSARFFVAASARNLTDREQVSEAVYELVSYAHMNWSAQRESERRARTAGLAGGAALAGGLAPEVGAAAVARGSLALAGGGRASRGLAGARAAFARGGACRAARAANARGGAYGLALTHVLAVAGGFAFAGYVLDPLGEACGGSV